MSFTSQIFSELDVKYLEWNLPKKSWEKQFPTWTGEEDNLRGFIVGTVVMVMVYPGCPAGPGVPAVPMAGLWPLWPPPIRPLRCGHRGLLQAQALQNAPPEPGQHRFPRQLISTAGLCQAVDPHGAQEEQGVRHHDRRDTDSTQTDWRPNRLGTRSLPKNVGFQLVPELWFSPPVTFQFLSPPQAILHLPFLITHTHTLTHSGIFYWHPSYLGVWRKKSQRSLQGEA